MMQELLPAPKQDFTKFCNMHITKSKELDGTTSVSFRPVIDSDSAFRSFGITGLSDREANGILKRAKNIAQRHKTAGYKITDREFATILPRKLSSTALIFNTTEIELAGLVKSYKEDMAPILPGRITREGNIFYMTVSRVNDEPYAALNAQILNFNDHEIDNNDKKILQDIAKTAKPVQLTAVKFDARIRDGYRNEKAWVLESPEGTVIVCTSKQSEEAFKKRLVNSSEEPSILKRLTSSVLHDNNEELRRLKEVVDNFDYKIGGEAPLTIMQIRIAKRARKCVRRILQKDQTVKNDIGTLKPLGKTARTKVVDPYNDISSEIERNLARAEKLKSEYDTVLVDSAAIEASISNQHLARLSKLAGWAVPLSLALAALAIKNDLLSKESVIALTGAGLTGAALLVNRSRKKKNVD